MEESEDEEERNLMHELQLKTVQDLRKEAARVGASSKGQKKEIIKRIILYQRKNLNSCLICPVNVVPALDETEFLTVEPYKTLDAHFRKKLNNFSIITAHEYFQVRNAVNSFNNGRPLFMDRFLKNISYSEISENVFQIRAYCCAAMKKTTIYQVKMEMSVSSNSITKAECECVAGYGKSCACKHMGALVCCIEYFIANGQIIQDQGCTNVLQKWHRPPSNASKELVNETVDEMIARRIERKSGVRNTEVNQPDLNVRTDLTNIFMESSINAGLNLTVHSSRYVNMDGLVNDHCYLSESLYESTVDNINAVSIEKIAEIEQKTRDQSDSQLWHYIRKSRITASCIKNIFTAIDTSISKRIPCNTNPARANFKRSNLSNIPQIKWGKAKESDAFDQFVRTYRGTRKFRKCGIFIDQDNNFLAASPDGICCCHQEIMEIKCPYTIRYDEPTNANFFDLEYKLKKTISTISKFSFKCI